MFYNCRLINPEAAYDVQYVNGKVYYKRAPSSAQVETLSTITGDVGSLELGPGASSFVVIPAGKGLVAS